MPWSNYAIIMTLTVGYRFAALHGRRLSLWIGGQTRGRARPAPDEDADSTLRASSYGR
jgi:hypothetical protein